MAISRFHQFICLFVTFALPACGFGFRIAEQNGDGREEEDKLHVVVEPRTLIVTSEADPRSYNELTATKISHLEGAFDFRPEQATELSLWVAKFEPSKCGDLESVKPEFVWAEVLADGTLGPRTTVEPQKAITVPASVTQRLTVKLSTSFGYCEMIQLRFEAHARGL